MSDNKQAQEREVYSVASYLEAVRECETFLQTSVEADKNAFDEEKPTMKLFYRGHASAEWQLIPSLFRTIPGVDHGLEIVNGINGSYFPEEQYLIQESERIFPELFASCKNDVSRMAVAQHHGIPTRLLDVSGDALVALYFATQKCIDEGKERDGRVFVFRASAHDYKMASTGGRIDTIRIGRYHPGQGLLEQGPLEGVDHPLLVFPPFETSRQKAQDGAFYLFQNKGDDVLHFKEKYYRVVTVPSSAKEAIRQDLESMLNVHRGTLFPEMLESYADKLKDDAGRRIRAEMQI